MPKKEIVILLTCIGRRVSLLRAFRRACSQLGYTARIVGTDHDENSPALQCCDRKFIVRSVGQRGYAEQVADIIKRQKVDLLVPTVDLDLSIWARRRARLGCTALISSPSVVRTCQDKRRMFAFLKEHGFDTPDTMSKDQALRRKRHRFPYFLKPWDGHASRGNFVARNAEELKFYARRVPNCLVQEFIEGTEYTADVLVDFDRRVRCVVPRRRIETRAGEVSKSVTVKHPEIIAQSRRLIEKLGAGPGVITIQCFLTAAGQIKFIEINPRFGGGIPLSIEAGANFPKWILQLWLGQKPRIKIDAWREGLIMLRYDEAIWYQP